jgi:multimeric flavodoxin WrbA
MPEILEKMIAADVIVMATPAYFYTMNAQMKTLVDRCAARYLEIKDKEFYFLVSAEDTDLKAVNWVLESFRAFTFCLEGSIEKGTVCGMGAGRIGELSDESRKQAYEMGKTV